MQGLRSLLARIDGRSYRDYKQLRGSYRGEGFELFIDHVQGDSFAEPSKLRLRVPMDEAGMPAELRSTPVRRLALGDFLARTAASAARSLRRRAGSGRSGELFVDGGAQEVLERSAWRLEDDFVELRLQAGLPADGRRVLAAEAERLLCEAVPRLAREVLRFESLDAAEVERFVLCIENQEALRSQLRDLGLVAFVADGSVLPRESGASDRPLSGADVVRFESPDSLAVDVDLPNPHHGERRVRGLGLREGVTLIVGGGYHGKSTLLKAVERGVHPHVPGDGRELVVTDPDAVKIRAEDGRRVERVDIGAFIDHLPQGRDTAAFRSEDASGSTSQAASIIEALESGARALLLDEDTSATNLMVRDARMQELVAREAEPITPFVDRVRELHASLGVSTLLVMGGCGDYFETADRVILMRDFVPRDATADAREVAAAHPTRRKSETARPLRAPAGRVPLAASFDARRGKRAVKLDARGVNSLVYGTTVVDLRGLEQLLDPSQTRAIGHAIHLATQRFMRRALTLAQVLDELDRLFDAEGLDPLAEFASPDEHPGNFARPRRHELAGVINRLRSLRVKPD
jgi:predicted ABC-class ATPase